MKKTIISFIIGSLLFLINCGGKTDKEVYESAKLNIDEENYIAALEDFKELVRDYPNSEFYQDALLQTGQLYQGHVNEDMTYQESLKKAIDSYRLYYSKYEDDPKAAQTLFMIGFIQANELGELDSAKITYTEFVEKYPDNEMAESARTELENLGLSADEILAKKIENKPE
ncbi:MAG: tetratricopeptide repeat protein [Bacteroidota bacterium]